MGIIGNMTIQHFGRRHPNPVEWPLRRRDRHREFGLDLYCPPGGVASRQCERAAGHCRRYCIPAGILPTSVAELLMFRVRIRPLHLFARAWRGILSCAAECGGGLQRWHAHILACLPGRGLYASLKRQGERLTGRIREFPEFCSLRPGSVCALRCCPAPQSAPTTEPWSGLY